MAGRLPPCIVLGVESQIGLGIVRELGAAGVPVIGMTHDPHAIGLASRYLSRAVIVATPRSQQTVDTINELAREVGDCCLLTVSEVTLEWLQSQRHQFRGVVPILPSPEALAIVLDKQRTLAIAREVGIRVPESTEPMSMADVERIARSFAFPAVLKWKDPARIAPRLSAHKLDLVKAEYVNTAEEFLQAARRYEPVGSWPLVQEYCAGRGLGQFFFMHRGQAVRRFQHLRIAEWPPEGGFSSVCDSVPLDQHVELQQKSIALLQRIGWEGVAMVEYRLDADTGVSRLMEVNGRFWGSFPLAVQCKAGFALLAYSLQGRGEMPALQRLRERIRSRMVATELKRLLRIWLQADRIRDRRFVVRPLPELWRFVRDFFRPRVHYFVWSLDDPKPFVRDMQNVLRKVIRR